MEAALLLQAVRAVDGLVSMAVDHYDVQRLRKRSVELRVMADECRDPLSSRRFPPDGQAR